MKRKIIYVITRMVVGGAQETAKYTAEHFHRTGDDVLFVTGMETGREGELKVVDVPVLFMPALVRRISLLNDLRAVWQLYRLFRRERPDVVHARTSKARVVAVVAARMARTPTVVQTIHGWSFGNEIDRKKWLYVLVEKLIARMFDCNVVVSEGDLQEGLETGILRAETTQLIRSGVNLVKVGSVDRERVARLRAEVAPDGQRIVTLIGRLSSPKTPDVFVDAAATVLAKHPNTRFLVVGDGAKREALAAQIERLGIVADVLMLGLRTDVAEIMAVSDILTHSSLREGLPKTVLEAMAAGKPVIGTNVGGVPAVVDDGVTGLLVDPSNAPQMAAAMLRLLEDSALCARLVANAAQRVQEFSLAKAIDDTNAMYERLRFARTAAART
jgi:glycosyltransferase involved in cell wall biosynthesis